MGRDGEVRRALYFVERLLIVVLAIEGLVGLVASAVDESRNKLWKLPFGVTIVHVLLVP